MERAPASFRSDNQPAMIGSLISKCQEEVLFEALWYPIISFTRLAADVKTHLLDEGMVKKVQRTFILIVTSIIKIGIHGPIDRFGCESQVSEMFSEPLPGPRMVHRPFFHMVR